METYLVVEPRDLSLWNGNESALQLSRGPLVGGLGLRSLRKGRWDPLNNVGQGGLAGKAAPVVLLKPANTVL